MRLVWLKFCLCFFIAATCCGEVKFTIVDGETTGVAPALRDWKSRSGYTWVWGVTAWDQDGDGKQDLVLTSHQSSPLTGSIILRGAGDGTFADVTAQLGLPSSALPHEYKPVVIDVDRDGKPDLLHATQGTGRIVFNRGSSLALGGTTSGVYSKSGYVTDLNGDGWLDWRQRYRGWGRSGVTEFVNDQAGGFSVTSREDGLSAGLPAELLARLEALRYDFAAQNRYCGPKWFAEDMNGDGTPDAAMQYAGSYANGTLGKPYRFGWYSVPTGIPEDHIPLAVRDVTGDGLVDVFVGYGQFGGLWEQLSGGPEGAPRFAPAYNPDLDKTLSLTSPPYLTVLEFHDFDKDGDDDLLVSTQRLGWLEIYENQGSGQFTKSLRAYHWDAEGWAVADFNGDGLLDIAVGGLGPVKWPTGPDHKDTNFTFYLNTAPPPFVVKLRHPLETADPSAPETVRFLNWCKLPAPYGLDGFRLALAYRISGDAAYARRAAAMANAYVATANALIASGVKPAISRDSYLHVYRETRAILFPLEWCSDEFTQEQKEAAEALCKQAVWNVWNFRQATWGDKAFPWSGWATSDPENNYHFNFCGATCLLALYEGTPASRAGAYQWLDRIAAAHDFRGGGSREGTGYGLSHSTLFEVYGTWLASTGERFPAIENHARASTDYWVAATAPGRKLRATIGDQSRESTGLVWDNQRAVILWARRLAAGDRLRAGDSGERVAGTSDTEDAWLTAYPKMTAGFNFHDDLVPTPAGELSSPVPAHSAHGVGHYFARSDWTDQATFLVFRAGARGQSHIGQEMGSFDFWGGGQWLANTENARTKSGIQQTTPWHNMLRFERAGVVIGQAYRGVGLSGVTDDASTWQADADLTGLYPGAGIEWKRTLVYDRGAGKLCVRDSWSGPAEIAAIWQLQVPTQTVVIDEATGIITAGKLRITVDKPMGGTVTVRDWRQLSPDAVGGGSRIEVTDSEKTGFDVTLEVLP